FPEKNPDIVIEIAVSGEIVYANPSARTLFSDLCELGHRHPLLGDFDELLFRCKQAMEKITHDCMDAEGRATHGAVAEEIAVGDRVYKRNSRFLPEYGCLRLYAYDVTQSRQAEENLNLFFDLSHDLLFIAGFDGYLKRVNRACEHTFGFCKEELLAVPYMERIHQDDVPLVHAELAKLVGGEAMVNIQVRVQRKNSAYQWTEWVATRAPDKSLFYATGRDISERMQRDLELKMAAKVIENTLEGVLVADSDGTILSVNPAFTRITGYTAEEAIGKTPRLLRSNHHDVRFYQQLWVSLLSTGQWQGEIWNRRKDGEAYPEWLTISAIRGENGVVQQYVSVFNDITKYKQQEAHIHHQAYYDALTDLPNRLLFADRLKLAVAHAYRNRQQLAVMFLDLDRFKQINDGFGHHVGDRLLQEVAKRLQALLRADDTVARLGGDEFTLLLPNLPNTDDATKVADQVIKTFDRPITIERHEIFTSTSIGIAIYPYDGMDAETLMKNADSAMYLAKRNGRNSHQLYTPDMNESAAEQLILENQLRRAIERDELVLHYQPQVNANTGEVVGIEALLRWLHPEKGLLYPLEFMALAEESGLIVAIGEWVLRTACVQNKCWQAIACKAVKVAVNVSARQFCHPHFVRLVGQVLEEVGMEPCWLELELTENILLRDIEQTISKLQNLKALGITLSIDDFGTGYSSMAYIKNFPFDTVKIDPSFIRDVAVNTNDAEIAKAIIAMAHSMNLKVIAEGVETIGQRDFMRTHRCDDIQGFYISQPLDAESMGEHLCRGTKGGLARP
ncbi:MAG: EAL domain-containing protein, partial [Methylovulum sp.]|nr:EAL domain-containing protein [Methylovulum sp.]